ncbi:hypothetical protein ABCS02_11310 [Microbacterium sp. X-17]|uniref:hypothetical protein n=1 Tax=Microbacterium sp. X-17 TaxID=3144404 RepID=UPI0031F49D3F
MTTTTSEITLECLVYDAETSAGAYRLVDEDSRFLRVVEGSTPVPQGGVVRRTRGTVLYDSGPVEPGATLFVALFPVPAEATEEFDAWFIEEHSQLLLDHEDWLRARLVELPGGRFSRLVIHDLANADVLLSPHRAAAGQTERTRVALAGDWPAGAVRYTANQA